MAGSPDPSASTVPLAEGARADEPAVGDVLASRYTLRRRLGAGGMGTVFEAHDKSLDITVALKVMRETGESAAKRLRRETRLARDVTHPNVCRVFDVGEDRDGRIVLTMELLDGPPLSELTSAGPLARHEALLAIDDVCAGLEAAHGAGIVHRDLKPANVMRSVRGGVKRMVLTDFGLASTDAGAIEEGGATSTGTMVAGTPAYMAPEQARGEPPTPAADLFSLGVLIAEVATGKSPFPPTRTIAEAAARPAVNRDVIGALPPRWRSVVERCLDADPTKRPRSAREVANALRGRRRIGFVIAALAVIAVVVAILLWPRASQPQPPDRPHSERAAALFDEAEVKLGDGDVRSAADLFARVVELEPAFAHGWSEISSAYRESGRTKQAIEAATRALADTTLPRQLVLRAESRLYLARHEWLRAITVLEALAQLDPANLSITLDLAEARLGAGRLLAAGDTLGGVRATTANMRARVDLLVARAAKRQGAPQKQRDAATRAADTARTAGLSNLEAAAIYERADAKNDLGDYAGAASDLEAAIAMFRTLGDERGLALAVREQAQSAALTGDNKRSNELLSRALEHARAGDDANVQAATLTALAQVALDEQRGADGKKYLDEALELYRALGDDAGIADVVASYGQAALDAGDVAGAVNNYNDALVRARQIGDQRRILRILGNLGTIAEVRGDYPAAWTFAEQAGALAVDGSNPGETHYFYSRLVWLGIELGRDITEHARVLGGVSALTRAEADAALAVATGDASASARALRAAADAYKDQDACTEQELRLRLVKLALATGGPKPEEDAKRAAELAPECGELAADWRGAVATALLAPPKQALAVLEPMIASPDAVRVALALRLDARLAVASAQRALGRKDATLTADAVREDARRAGLVRLERRAAQLIP